MALIRASSFFDADNDFSLDNENLEGLEIRNADLTTGFHYFYDRTRNRIIKSFVLSDRPRTALMCDVILIRKSSGPLSPRLRFWIRDKTKRPKREIGSSELPNTAENRRVKASVDTSEAHENLWKLIGFLQGFSGIELPDDSFSIVDTKNASLVRTLQEGDRASIVEAIRLAIGSSLTERDIALIANRRGQLEHFRKLLQEPDFFTQQLVEDAKKPEKYWQDFFETNRWIFGYGLKLISCQGMDERRLERFTSGANIFQGAGKRVDAIMRTNGFISSLLFCEIKTHETELLSQKRYRDPDVYCASSKLTGAVAQVQKTARKAVRQLSDQLKQMRDPDGTPTGVELSTTRPRQAVLIGNLKQLGDELGVNAEKVETFELFRTSITDTEIITFDELYERAKFIVNDGT